MKDRTTTHRRSGWRAAAAVLALVAVLAGCGTDATDDTLLPTPAPATDPLDPSE